MESNKNQSGERLTAKGFSRRDFLKGAAIGAMGIAVTGLAGCAQTNASATSEPTSLNTSQTSAASSSSPPSNVSKTLECDVLIAGGGLAGLAAAVQAGESGLSAIVLEASSYIGGNGGVEGVFGCNTSAQKEQGIELDPGSIIRHDLEFSQYRSDGALLADLISATAENYDWLVEQGVTFNGHITAYGGVYATQHDFEGGSAAVGYIPAMEEKARSYGVEFMTETPCKSLILDDGKVTGVYAQDADGNDIKINAKAVVLATGGFGYNDEYLAKWGFPIEYISKVSNRNGDGLRMSLEVGAKDCIADACFLATPNIDGLFSMGQAANKLCFGGPFLWVNQDCKRFVNEDLAGYNLMSAIMPVINQKTAYCVADSTIVKEALAGEGSATDFGAVDAKTEFNEVLEDCPSNNVYKADSLSELAGKFGVDADALQAAVDRYNELCTEGKDLDFCKDASAMVPITTPPYYMYRLDPAVVVAIGGIGTNRDMQVVNDADEPIPGLYAIGVDGVRLYRRVYPINIPATCSANNVNSGRTAIRHIKANI